MERGDAYFSIPAEIPSDAEDAEVVDHLEAPAVPK
jgi:hypothetical protein